MRKLLILLALFVSPVAEAATLYIDPGVATLYRGDAVKSAVRIMPDQAAGECINAVDATITYSDNIQPVDVSIGNSIFNAWIEQPTINPENRTITFAGGIPNGYCGRVEGDPRLTNIIAEIVFRSPGMMIGGGDNNEVLIDFGDTTQVLLNDGLGTVASLRTLGARYTLDRAAGAELNDPWRDSVRADNIPPEEFSLDLYWDSSGINFTGKYMLVFSTVDKQTGIDYYEVMEEPVLEFSQFKWGGVGVPWVRADSPYEIKDQTLNSIIRVKAVDKAGNEYIATFVPDQSLQTLSKNELYTYLAIAGSALVVVILIIAAVIFWRRRRSVLEPSELNEEGNLLEFEDK
jgi:hypothetical protein